MDFGTNPEAAEKFASESKRWLCSTNSTPPDLETFVPDHESRREAVDIVGYLLASAHDGDSIARAFFYCVAETTGHWHQLEWRSRFEDHYLLRSKVQSLLNNLRQGVPN